MTNYEEVAPLDEIKIGSTVEIVKDKNGIDQIILRNLRGASARISLYGGQVLSWQNEEGHELLFMSTKFGRRGLLEQHGFARNRIWVIDDQPPSPCSNGSNGHASINLLLIPSDEDLKVWPHRFEIRHKITLTDEGHLVLRSRVKNANGKPISFSIAFRTYFGISDIGDVRVEGLETLDYLDNLQEKERFTEQGDALTFESEMDRIYLNSSDTVAIFDHGRKRTFQIRKQGLPDVAVWNPWEKKAKAMTDIGDEEYKEMVCVDGAAVEKPITLKPGEEWMGQLELSVRSFC